MTRARRLALGAPVAGVLVVGACAGGVGHDPGNFGKFEDGGDSASSTSLSGGVTTGVPDDDDDGEPSLPPDLGACVDDEDCLVMDAGCYANGHCVGGVCENPPKFAGDPCDDGDTCTGPDVCDGAGTCIGEPLPCVAPNATGGTCSEGLCMGLTCDPGFGNCNGDWVDGCEHPLVDDDNCGECGNSCDGGANASGTCNAGACEMQCEGAWANCDGDWSNGCEIPEGVPNQCDVNGLNPGGCWTPWCGQSDAAGAVNFGTWFCFECSNCHAPAPGQCQWCDHATGLLYPMAACGGCGAYEDLACTP